MIGDGLSHVGFGVLTVATAFGATSPLYIAVPCVTISAIILLKIGNNSKIKSDSAIALISSSALAIGVAVTSVTTGMNTDVCNFMFGSILAMSKQDVYLSIVVSIIVASLFIIYYRKLFVVTFDEDDNGDTCYAVVRNTPGCCGNDGLAGLDIRYDKDYPNENTWVEVIGVIGTDTMYGDVIPAIQVSSIIEKEEGTTFVTN